MPCKILFSKENTLPKVPDWRPLVIVSCAISIDGKLASICGDSRLSSYEDKVEVHKLRSKVDAILVGINTVLADDPHLTVSEKYYKSNKHPIRIVLDSKCRIPLNAQVIRKRPEVQTIIATTKKAPKEKIAKLRKIGVDVHITNSEKKVDITELLKYIRKKYGVRKLMVEGGGKVIGEFIKNNLVDTMRISITPILFGGQKATPIIMGPEYCTIEQAPKFEITKIELCGNNIVIHLTRHQTHDIKNKP